MQAHENLLLPPVLGCHILTLQPATVLSCIRTSGQEFLQGLPAFGADGLEDILDLLFPADGKIKQDYKVY